METVGFIGTGSLAAFFIEGCQRAGAPYRFIVSPRNRERALAVAARFGVEIARDNQAVVDRAGFVIASVLPKDGPGVLRSLQFRPGQTVLSVMAAVARDSLLDIVAPAEVAVAMMPGHANALGLGPSVLYPDHTQAHAFLAWLGPVHGFDNAQTYAAASAFGGYSGCTFAFIGEAIGWAMRHGIDAATARALICEMLIGNAEVVRSSAVSMDDLLGGVATPGGITRLGLDVLGQRRALAAWSDALDAIEARMRGGDAA